MRGGSWATNLTQRAHSKWCSPTGLAEMYSVAEPEPWPMPSQASLGSSSATISYDMQWSPPTNIT